MGGREGRGGHRHPASLRRRTGYGCCHLKHAARSQGLRWEQGKLSPTPICCHPHKYQEVDLKTGFSNTSGLCLSTRVCSNPALSLHSPEGQIPMVENLPPPQSRIPGSWDGSWKHSYCLSNSPMALSASCAQKPPPSPHHGGAAHTQPQHCWSPSPCEPPNTSKGKPGVLPP